MTVSDILEETIRPGIAVVVGNPPYQRNISGSTEAKRLRNASKSVPIYHDFIDVLRTGRPLRFSLIVPAKWYAGGWGLEAFRRSMFADCRIASLVDFRGSEHLFARTDVNGGLAILHWELEKQSSSVHITRYGLGFDLLETGQRELGSPDRSFLLRDHRAISILQKTGSLHLPMGQSFASLIMGSTPYGIPSNFSEWSKNKDPLNTVPLLRVGKSWVWTGPEARKGTGESSGWRVFIPLSHSERGKTIMGPTALGPPASLCTHSYLSTLPFTSRAEAESAQSYLASRFFRFVAAQLKISPIATRHVYRLAPLVPWDRVWTDGQLYERHSLDEQEIAYIEATVDEALPALRLPPR